MQDVISNQYNSDSGHRPSANDQPVVIRAFANFFSWVFHPLFITCYVMFFLIFLHPYVFAGFDYRTKVFRFLNIFLCTTFLPLFSVFLMWRLGLFMNSLQMRTTRERIIPYVIVMIFYWWPWNVFRSLPDTPSIVIHFLLGNFLAICFAWMSNIFYKISMHAVAMGGLMMFFFLFALQDSYASGLYISVAFLIAGIVCTSRFIVSDHSPVEIYSGLFVGLFAQFIAWQF